MRRPQSNFWDPDELTNLVASQYAAATGRMTTNVAISLFDAPPAPEITEPTLLIKIPKLWYPSISAQKLCESTAGWVGDQEQHPTKQCSLRLLRCKEHYPRGMSHQRLAPEAGRRQWLGRKHRQEPCWGFEGEIAEEMAHYRNHSVKHLCKKGDATEIRYFCCD